MRSREVEAKRGELAEVLSKVLNGLTPVLKYELADNLSPECVVGLFKLIWMSQLYSIYKEKSVEREGVMYNVQEKVRMLKSNIRNLIMAEHNFHPEVCNTKYLLLKAYWNYKSTNVKFEQDMSEAMRIKQCLETEIYTGKEVEELALNPRNLKRNQFEEWYRRVERKYEERKDFTDIREDQLYKWQAPKTSFFSSLANTFSVWL